MEGLSQNDLLLLLPTEAAKSADAAKEEMEILANIYKGQRFILEELSNEIPDFDEEAKSIATKEAVIKSLDKQISEIQKTIIEELSKKSTPQQSCSDILYNLLTTVQKRLYDICEDAAESGKETTDVSNILKLEDELAKTIAELSANGKYPMTPEQMQEKRDATSLHNQKVGSLTKQVKITE